MNLRQRTKTNCVPAIIEIITISLIPFAYFNKFALRKIVELANAQIKHIHCKKLTGKMQRSTAGTKQNSA